MQANHVNFATTKKNTNCDIYIYIYVYISTCIYIAPKPNLGLGFNAAGQSRDHKGSGETTRAQKRPRGANKGPGH